MIKKYVAMGLGALIAVSPVVAMAHDRQGEDPHGLAQDAQDLEDPHGQEEDDRSSEELIDEIRAAWGARTRCEGGRVITAPFVC